MINDLAEIVAALYAVLNLPEDFADLVLDGIGAGGPLRESVEVGEELPIDEIQKVVAGLGLVVVDLILLAPLSNGERPMCSSDRLDRECGCMAFRGGPLQSPSPPPARRDTLGREVTRSARCSPVRWCNRHPSRGHCRCF